MALKITNISHQLLVVTLNSGKTIHLASREASEPVMEVEIKDNPKLEKMARRSLITIEEEKKRRGGRKKEGMEKSEEEEEKEES